MKKSSLLLRQNNLRKTKTTKKIFHFSLCIFLFSIFAISMIYVGIPHIKKSTLFGFKNILFEPTEHISEKELKSWMRLPRKKNVLDIDLNQLESRIREHPWVADVHVARALPNHIRIEIQEKKPYAILSLGNRYFLDRQGRKIAMTEAIETESFPIVSGIHLEEKEKILEGYQLIEEYKKRFIINSLPNAGPLSRIHWNEVSGFIIFTPSLEMRMGKEAFSKRFLRLEKVLKDLTQKSQIPSLIDLNYSKKVVVKLTK